MFFRNLIYRHPRVLLLFRMLFISLLILGLVVALIPLKLPETGLNFADKIIHLLVFICFAFGLDLITKQSYWKWQVPLLSAYGILTEVLQALTPWRSFSILDWISDFMGLLIYGVFFLLIRKIKSL